MVNFGTMKKRTLLLLLLPFAALAQNGEDAATIKKIADEILRNGKAYDLLRQLTKDIGGRLAGSPQFAKAVQWGKITLESVGADTVYLQECMVPHWIRGVKDEVMITENDHKKLNRKLDALALGNSLGNGKPVVAEVIAVKDFAELEKRKEEVKGKIVFYNHV